MTDSDEDDCPARFDISRARKFSWTVVVAAGFDFLTGIANQCGETCEVLGSIAVAHEKWRDDNALVGRQIESLVDVSPFE